MEIFIGGPFWVQLTKLGIDWVKRKEEKMKKQKEKAIFVTFRRKNPSMRHELNLNAKYKKLRHGWVFLSLKISC